MNDNINKTVNEILESYSKHEQTCRLSEDNIINKSVLIQVLEEIRKLLFPGYFDKNRVREEYIGYIVGDRIEFIQYNLKKQIAKAGIDVDNLVDTVEEYNDFCDSVDEEFFKDKRYLKPITKAPFYGARIRPRSEEHTSELQSPQ